jgi:zinc transport system substrate-binding protein
MIKVKRIGAVICLVGMLVAALGCQDGKATTQSTSSDKADKLIAFVSVLPQADFVRQLGGEKVEVNVMMPPGANEHSYEPDSGQLKALSQADFYVKVGSLPFEDAWMERFMAANKDMLVVGSSQSIELIDDNPHIWLSPRLVKLQAQGITEAMIKLDPENRDYYQERNQAFLQQLDSLDKEITEILSSVKGKSFLVYHPAWGYFARDYGLKEVGIEEHGKEPGAGEMARIIEYAKQHNIKTVFASTQHSTRSAEAVASELGGKVVVIDPLPASYFDNMRQVAGIMARELAEQ